MESIQKQIVAGMEQINLDVDLQFKNAAMVAIYKHNNKLDLNHVKESIKVTDLLPYSLQEQIGAAFQEKIKDIASTLYLISCKNVIDPPVFFGGRRQEAGNCH